MSPRLFFRAVVVPGALLAVLGTILVANAASPGATVKIAPAAALANPPSSVIVTVDYSCVPSAYSYGSVNVDQAQTVSAASGGRIDIFGYGNFQPTCDDKSHRANVVVSAFFGSFAPGTASASAFVAAGAAYANTSNEITIK